MSSSAQSCG